MAFTLIGLVEFRGGMDPEGHREYKVKYKVGTTSNQDGPAAALKTPGLPAVGSTYAYGTGAEYDLWAWRQPQLEVEPVGGVSEGDFPYLWYVTCTFSTKPRRRDQERPQNGGNNGAVEDPLNEPQKVSGSWTKEKEEAFEDRHGEPIQYSSFEPIRGPLNEWDADKDAVTVEQNVAQLDYATFGPMKNCLNDRPLWGLPARAVKLSGAEWRKNYGKNNSAYYVRTFKFDIRTKFVTKSSVVGGVRSTAGSSQLEVPIGSFGNGNVGQAISGTGIPAGTVITSVSYHTSGSGWTTMFVNLSTQATVTGTIFATLTSPGGRLVGDWDRDILDESGKCLSGYWSSTVPRKWVTDAGVDPDNPADYITCKDANGETCRLVLDGGGVPWDESMPAGSQGKIHVEFYREANFLLLNIPLQI